jgi:hypothetical protein
VWPLYQCQTKPRVQPRMFPLQNGRLVGVKNSWAS